MAATIGTHMCNGEEVDHLFIHHDSFEQYYSTCEKCGTSIALSVTPRAEATLPSDGSSA